MLRIRSIIEMLALGLLAVPGMAEAADLDRPGSDSSLQGRRRTEATDDTRQDDATVPPRRRHRLTYSNLLVVRYNPLGCEDQIDLRYRFRLYQKTSLLYRDAHLGVAFTPTINFALSRVGVSVIANPLAVVTLSAGYYFNVWYHAFGHLQSFPSARDAHSDTDLDRRDEDHGLSYGTTGHEAQLSAVLLAKAGAVVFRSDNSFHFTALELKGGDTVYYTPRQDVLMPNRGWIMTSDLDVVYLTAFGFLAGIRASLVHAFYTARSFADGEPMDNPSTPTIRIGPIAAYTFFDRPNKKLNKPTILLIVNWWLLHRYRTGEDVPRSIPYALLGFRLEGDLWGRD
jgi:hypothetical protein